jgi:hypothetical protein
MANKTIIDLTELTSLESDDLLIAYDISAAGSEKSRKITKTNAFTGLAASGHNHNDLYYTDAEIDSISGALNIAKADVIHNHDDRYYTDTELNNGQLDSRYYTETETDTISGALNTKISNLSSDKISEGNSSVEVIDAGTGRVEVTADGVLCAYMRAQEQAFYSAGINALTISVGGGVHYSYFGDGQTFFTIEGDYGGGYTNLFSSVPGAPINMAGNNISSVRKTMLVADPDTSVDLYYAGVKKLETTSTGAKVTGDLETTNYVITYGVRGVGTSALDLIAGSDGRRRVQITSDNYVYLSQSGENAVKNAAFEIYRNDVPDVPVARFKGSSLSGRAPGVQIYAGGGSGDSVLDVRKGDATTQLFKVDGAGNAIVAGDLSVGGNLTVTGTQFYADVQTVLIEDNLLVINKNETGSGVTAGVAGIEVERGSVDNYLFYFDETQDNFRVGISGSLQAVATREDSPTNSGIAFWNDAIKMMSTNSNFVFNDNEVYGFKVGIGTPTPDCNLHVMRSDASAASDPNAVMTLEVNNHTILQLLSPNNKVQGIKFGDPDNHTSGYLRYSHVDDSMQFWTSSTNQFTISSSGAVTIANLAGSGNRAVYSDPNGVLTNSSSDLSLKKNIESLLYGLSEINKMNPIKFNWIPENLGAQKEIGFIAQEMETIVPEVVGTNSDGLKSLDYPKLVAVLCKAVQELSAKNDALEARLTAAGL